MSTPAGTVDAIYANYLADHDLASDDPGVSVGQKAAARILKLRAGNNGGIPPDVLAFFGGNRRGDWRPTTFDATSGAPVAMTAAYLARVTPFTLKRVKQFRADPPPALNSPRYTRDYNEVKSLGAFVNSGRTPEQNDTALLFADNAVQYWNRTLRTIADEQLLGIGRSARMPWSTWRWLTR